MTDEPLHLSIMIICVTERGDMRLIELVGPIQVVAGTELNRLIDGSGAEWFFTSNGHYDGHGGALPPRQEGSEP